MSPWSTATATGTITTSIDSKRVQLSSMATPALRWSSQA